MQNLLGQEGLIPKILGRYDGRMQRVEYLRWMIPGHTGKLHRSTWDMTEEEAQRRYPGCERVPGTCTVRMLPETDEEMLLGTTTGRSWSKPDELAAQKESPADREAAGAKPL